MGKYFVRFKCHHCGHCCRDVICLPTPWDVIRLVRETGANPYEFIEFVGPEDISEVPKSDPTWLRCNGKRHMMALRRNKHGCYFLHEKTRHCTVYEARPLLCRLYPKKLHESRQGEFKAFSLHKNVGCPRHRDGIIQTDPLYELYLSDRDHQEDYMDLVQVFNRDKSPDKRPADFLALFIAGIARPNDSTDSE
ncbi:MAG TPA: YkgJ family cysteine cluster protein [Candidatus Hydrogenedentes bacterium]|nr:YkgJ family cysteine cluster protein [Candidatus Hydrogenedentota bacterium]HOV75485.1 YkgJ family cysteine cluster protein [Candidatus Hydrogenedentota bacterium]